MKVRRKEQYTQEENNMHELNQKASILIFILTLGLAYQNWVIDGTIEQLLKMEAVTITLSLIGYFKAYHYLKRRL